jgi:hypothetical protein
MSDEKQISLPNYIIYSLSAAWKLVQINPRAMEYFDLTSDGFWKSFWAIALIIPVFVLNIFYTQGAEVPQPLFSSAIYYITALPLTAFVMYHFTKFMKIDEHYASMVIAYNWLSVVAFNIIEILTLLLITMIPTSTMVAPVIIAIRIYLGGYVGWFMFKKSLRISGGLAFGVLIFEVVFVYTYRAFLLRFLDPETFAYVSEVASNPPA